jgi:hypothetical protein|tara:strand:+ start:501 stop:707 length:207 start_codon:yes stop_codon:yes gene_type:complete
MLAQMLDNPHSVVNYDSATAFTDFSYYSKQRDPEGDVVCFSATMTYGGEYYAEALVTVQNNKIISYST